MNTFRQLLIASILVAGSAAATAEQAPAVQAPSPTIKTGWSSAPAKANVSEKRVLLSAYQEDDTWTFRELIGSREVELKVTEMVAGSARKLVAMSDLRIAGL